MIPEQMKGNGSHFIAGASLCVREAPTPLTVTPEIERQIDLVWKLELARRPHLHDAKIFSFVRLDAGILWGRFVDYRYFLSQHVQPKLRPHLNIVPIGVSGLVRLRQDRHTYYVFARRSQAVSQYPGFWELIPSGGLDRGSVTPTGEIDFKGQIIRELEEEANINRAYLSRVEFFGLVFDPGEQVYDLCFEIDVRVSYESVHGNRASPEQYESLHCVRHEGLEQFAREAGGRIVPTSLSILKAKELLISDNPQV